MLQIFDVRANENACYKRNELELNIYHVYIPYGILGRIRNILY